MIYVSLKYATVNKAVTDLRRGQVTREATHLLDELARNLETHKETLSKMHLKRVTTLKEVTYNNLIGDKNISWVLPQGTQLIVIGESKDCYEFEHKNISYTIRKAICQVEPAQI